MSEYQCCEPTTWEKAAEQAAAYVSSIRSSINPLVQIEKNLTLLRDEHKHCEDRFAFVGTDALSGYMIFVPTDKTMTLDHVCRVLAQKQHDYGHDNIAWGGRQGLVLRMHDKLARIRNLESRTVDSEAANEPLADSWLDLVGYAIIGVMWERGTFMLPLAADVVEANAADVIAPTEQADQTRLAPTTQEIRNIVLDTLSGFQAYKATLKILREARASGDLDFLLEHVHG
jgi:Nucleotide modification associated domain 1